MQSTKSWFSPSKHSQRNRHQSSQRTQFILQPKPIILSRRLPKQQLWLAGHGHDKQSVIFYGHGHKFDNINMAALIYDITQIQNKGLEVKTNFNYNKLDIITLMSIDQIHLHNNSNE